MTSIKELLEFLQDILEYHLKRRSAIAKYLDAIADEADNLAGIWGRALAEYENGKTALLDDIIEHWENRERDRHRADWAQSKGYSTLFNAYKDLYRVVSKSGDEQINSQVNNVLAQLLISRNRAKEVTHRNIYRLQNVNDLEEAVLAIQETAGELRALAMKYRAMHPT